MRRRARTLLLAGAALLALLATVAYVLVLEPRRVREEGVRQYREAKELDQAGETSRAGQAYTAAERAKIDTPEFWTDYAHFRMRNGGALLAEPLFRRALDRDATYGPAHLGLAEVYLRLERPEDAGQEYGIAAFRIPDRAPELFVNAGMAFLGAGKRDRARALFRRALAAKPGYEPALAGLEQTEATPPTP